MAGETLPLFRSVAMLAVFAPAIGVAWLIAQRRDARRGALIPVMAPVLPDNVLIAAWPAR